MYVAQHYFSAQFTSVRPLCVRAALHNLYKYETPHRKTKEHTHTHTRTQKGVKKIKKRERETSMR